VVAQRRNEAPDDVEARINVKIAEIGDIEKQQADNNTADGTDNTDGNDASGEAGSTAAS
jgi:hypothetical protein